LEDHALNKLSTYVSHPFATPATSNKEEGHHGIDFSYWHKDGNGAPILGVNIQSILPGRVAGIVKDRTPYGNMVLIETSYANMTKDLIDYLGISPNFSLYHLYAHMLNPPTWQIGDPVACGEVIGQVGNTGYSGNEHLHLETRLGPAGTIFPALVFYSTTATVEEMENYVLWRSSGIYQALDPMTLFTSFFPLEP
jgi:murein DD-endopeptidase MepM/ murein hydrolase activator NlpD